MRNDPSCFEPFLPRNGPERVCAIVARTSATDTEVPDLNDQIDQCKMFAISRFSGPIRFIEVTIEGDGVRRHEKIVDLQNQIANGSIDLVLAVALTRISRLLHAYRFLEQCTDLQTRVVILDDRIDTGASGRRLPTIDARFVREQLGRSGAPRIQRVQRNRFREGGNPALPIFGYHTPPGANTVGEIQKDPDAEPVIREIFRMLEHGNTFSEVAAWLNQSKISTSPHCHRAKWTGAMLQRFVRMPLLKGQRVRQIYSRQVCPHCRSRVAETTNDTRNCPDLAFFTEEYFDFVMDMVDRRFRGQRRHNS